MNPHRLSFEQFRDSLIANSRELDEQMGGKGQDLLSMRRSVYVTVDRQYLPNVFSVFDFANPDFHSSQRSETTNPQQALFALNSSFVAERARKITGDIRHEANNPDTEVARAFQIIFQRSPSPEELNVANQFLESAKRTLSQTTVADKVQAWSYGYGEIDSDSGVVKSFHRLPYFAGSAWQGGPLWPDSRLGWVRLTAKGGHVGNDDRHAAIRRWTANASGVISIKSELAHQDTAGDGVRCWIVSNKDGVIAKTSAYNDRKEVNVASLAVSRGDTVDFVVDLGKSVSNDEFMWIPTISRLHGNSGGALNPDRGSTTWNAAENFPRVQLTPLEQLVQMLLISNEAMFVD
jgi:hypothetical protein